MTAGPVDENAARGAKNIVESCLCVTPGERVHLLVFRAEGLYALLARAVEEVGAIPVRVDLEPIDATDGSVADFASRLIPMIEGASATILLAPQRPKPTLSVAIARAAEQVGSRHLHLLQVDERLLGQSVRADPELLEIVNGRLSAALSPPCILSVKSDAGTDLEVRLALTYPILSSAGRPRPKTSENLPAGHVYTHPARVSGVLVVDRAIFGPGLDIDRHALRRAPARVTFASGRVSHVDASDPDIAAAFDTYLASHADAGRVGLLVWPTNYLVRSEIGIDRQDMLLPGMSVSLGYASPESTGANYEAPVQMVLLGRKQTIEVSGRKLVDAGRFDGALVEGIDPFR